MRLTTPIVNSIKMSCWAHLVHDGVWGCKGAHAVHVHLPKGLLEGFECKPTQFGLDQVRPVLHNGLEADVLG